uniref:Carbonic anhydrase n=1 Tax=Plectus sambesii TaxID=2011161 RepID=A0A914XAC7_9BILA
MTPLRKRRAFLHSVNDSELSLALESSKSGAFMAGIIRILNGIIKYRGTVRKDLVKQFERVRDNPTPTAVFFTCMDSRMLPTRFTQAQVGDMFVLQNSGNIIPHAKMLSIILLQLAFSGGYGYEVSVTTESAALEMAVKRVGIKHVIVCGHSDCKAMNTLYNLHKCPDTFRVDSPMDLWLRRHGFASLQKLTERLQSLTTLSLKFIPENPDLAFEALIDTENKFGVEDKLSQINTLQQLENITSHAVMKEFLSRRQVALHAMWFDIYTGNVFLFSRKKKRFVNIDVDSTEELLAEVYKNFAD